LKNPRSIAGIAVIGLVTSIAVRGVFGTVLGNDFAGFFVFRKLEVIRNTLRADLLSFSIGRAASTVVDKTGVPIHTGSVDQGFSSLAGATLNLRVSKITETVFTSIDCFSAIGFIQNALSIDADSLFITPIITGLTVTENLVVIRAVVGVSVEADSGSASFLADSFVVSFKEGNGDRIIAGTDSLNTGCIVCCLKASGIRVIDLTCGSSGDPTVALAGSKVVGVDITLILGS